MKNSRLYDALKIWLGQECPWAHLAHLTTCGWMVFALIQTGSVSLTKWTTYLPCRGLYAQSKPRRVRRWLGNSRINIHRLYKQTADPGRVSDLGSGVPLSLFRHLIVLGGILPDSAGSGVPRPLYSPSLAGQRNMPVPPFRLMRIKRC